MVNFCLCAGMSGWIPASRRQNGPGKKRRSCCIWPSWCPLSGEPSLPLLGELLPSAWSTTNTCCKDVKNHIMSLSYTLYIVRTLLDFLRMETHPVLYILVMFHHCLFSIQRQGGTERQWGRSRRRPKEIKTWRNWPKSRNQTCQTRSCGHGWRFVFLAF